jgi:phosphoribosylamine-glycine ligase
MNQKVGGIVGGIVMTMIAVVMFPLIMDTTHDLQTDSTDDSFAGETTGVGETSVDVVLTYENYPGDTTGFTITSTNANDTPVASVYVNATKTLTVGGLEAEGTRDLVATYEHDALTEYTGMGSMVNMAPLLLFVGLLFGGGLSIWSTAKR